MQDAETGGEGSLGALSVSIVDGIKENGRTYASYGKEGWSGQLGASSQAQQTVTDQHCQEYGAPMDEQEMDRIDMAHAKYFILLEKKRWLAPIPKSPHNVLDLACGTGQSSSPFLVGTG